MANVLDNSSGSSLLDGLNPLDNITGQLTGIISSKPIAKFLSGARCLLRVNGKIVGFATSVSWTISTSATEIRTIDDYLPYELAPSIISVTGSIGGFRIPGSGPTTHQIQSHLSNFLHQRYIEIEVRDVQTDNIIFKTSRAMVTSRSENISVDSLATMSLNFTAIGFVDEVFPEEPEGVNDARVSPTGANKPQSPVDKLVSNLEKLNPFK